MSQYTTGEMAKLCQVSVRTVQYYDARGILLPSELTEGGRRLYNEEDLRRLRVICFLRDLGISIDSIGKLLREEAHPERVIEVLLEQQRATLTEEIREREDQLEALEEVRSGLRQIPRFTVESIGDVAYIMQNKQKTKRMRWILLGVGLLMDAIEVFTLMLWIFRGIWLPFALGMGAVIAMGIGVSVYYFKHTVYLCPDCHTVFRGGFREHFFARHTPTLRKLTCPVCGEKKFCVETYGEMKEDMKNAQN